MRCDIGFVMDLFFKNGIHRILYLDKQNKNIVKVEDVIPQFIQLESSCIIFFYFYNIASCYHNRNRMRVTHWESDQE